MRILSSIIILMLALFQPLFSFAGEKEEAMGKQLFMRYCAQCHGEKGLGDGPNVKAAEMDPQPRDLCDIENVGTVSIEVKPELKLTIEVDYFYTESSISISFSWYKNSYLWPYINRGRFCADPI